MKAIYGIIIAATAASLALVSCNKEFDSPDRAETGGLGEERVITLTFDEATKSQISGYHPSFKAGDKILLSNGGSKEECTVSVDSYGATVTTTLTGTLKAVYPSSAAVLSGNAITGVQVSSTQHGTFAEANIAMAEDIIPGGMARFKLKTAVLRFYVDETIDVKGITVTSAGADIASDGGGKTISVTPDGTAVSGATTLYDMTVGHPDRRICYVAVLPGVTASDLTFTSDTESQGIVTRQSPGTGTLAVKGMYDAFIPYYINLGAAGKWAYCNVGAFLPEEYGDYFAWGNTTGHALKAENLGKTGTISSAFESDYNFSWANCPYQTENATTYADTKFTKYLGSTTSPYKRASAADADALKTVLDLADDAAYVNWGGAWLMPTSAEFKAMREATYWAWDGTDCGYYVFMPGLGTSGAANGRGTFNTSTDNKSNALLFFPAAGYGAGTSLKSAGSQGYYWSSSLVASNPTQAYRLGIDSSHVYPQGDDLRYGGFSVRPIYKNPVDPLDIGEYDEPENIE